MKLWIARDEVGIAKGWTPQLALYENEPFLNEVKKGMFFTDGNYYVLPEYYFPEVTFENSPQEVELKIVNNVQGK